MRIFYSSKYNDKNYVKPPSLEIDGHLIDFSFWFEEKDINDSVIDKLKKICPDVVQIGCVKPGIKL